MQGHPSVVIGFKMWAPQISKEEQSFFQFEAELLHFLEKTGKPHLLFLNFEKNSKPRALCEKILNASPLTDWVVSSAGLTPSDLTEVMSFPQARRLITPPESASTLEIKQLIENLHAKRQNQALLEMLREQNGNLESQNQVLNKKVQRKNKQSELAESRLLKNNRNLELLSKGLLNIQNIHSISLIEKNLHQLINQMFPVSWVRILFERQSSLERVLSDKNLLIFELDLEYVKQKGWMIVSPSPDLNLSEEEQEFLEEISDSVSLAVRRTINLDRAENIKQQWDATFDAISNPLCLVDDELQIIRTNKAFSLHAKMKFAELIGKNALQSFFKENPEIWKRNPPLNVKLQIENQTDGKYYSLVVHDLHFHIDKKRAHLLLIQDITDQYRMEKKIREKTKLVELGTIGSSIAHELNNPLAGMLSYLQLILMDTDPNSDLHKEVKEMELGTLKCRDIIQNLLGFSRKQTESEKIPTNLNRLMEKAIQLVEIQSRFSAIKIQLRFSDVENPIILGDQNALVQGMTHILKNSVEALQEKMQNQSGFMAEIKISIEASGNQYRVLISDNGPGIPSRNLEQVFNPLFSTKSGPNHSGLGLTVAYSIFLEHDGGLELSSPRGQGVTAIISLPRPELGPDSRGIDTQI